MISSNNSKSIRNLLPRRENHLQLRSLRGKAITAGCPLTKARDFECVGAGKRDDTLESVPLEGERIKFAAQESVGGGESIDERRLALI